MKIGWLVAGLALLLTCHAVKKPKGDEEVLSKGILTYAFNPEKPDEKEVVAEFTEQFNRHLSLALNTELEATQHFNQHLNLAFGTERESISLTEELRKYIIATIREEYHHLPPVDKLANIEMPITAPQSDFMEKLFPDSKYPLAKKSLEYAFAYEATGNHNTGDHHNTIKRVEGATDPEGKDRMVWEYDLGGGEEESPRRLASLNYLRQWKTATDVNIKGAEIYSPVYTPRWEDYKLEIRKGKTDKAKRLEFLAKLEDLLKQGERNFGSAYVKGAFHPAKFEVIVTGFVPGGPVGASVSDFEGRTAMRGHHPKKGGRRSRNRRRSKSKSKRSNKH